MMSWTHKLMSQGNKVVETTPGQSQKLFKAPETVSLTEKNEKSHQSHNRHHNDGKVTSLASLLGLPVELSNGIAFQTKYQNNNQTYIQRGQWGIQTGCLGGPTHRTEPEHLSVIEVYWNSSRNNIGLI